MSKTCPECLSGDLQDENINGHNTLICTGCGTVIDENDLSEEIKDFNPIFGVSNNMIALAHKRKVGCADYRFSKSKLKWGEVVKNLCKQFKFNYDMEKQALNYIFKACDMEQYHGRHREMKYALCAACVYLTCRCSNWPVTLDFVVYISSVSRDKLSSAFKELVKSFGMTIEFMRLEDFIPICLWEHGLEKLQLEEQVAKILCLSEEAWLATGRNRKWLVLAATYIAWKAIPENFNKKKKHFSQMVSRKFQRTWSKRVKEIEEVLIKLSSNIPWVLPDTLIPDRVGCYVNDIMKYKLTLFSQFEIKDDDDDAKNEDVMLNMEDDPKNVSDSQELTEHDLPEDEMHLYLKSSQEIASEKLHFDFDNHSGELLPNERKKGEKRTLLEMSHECDNLAVAKKTCLY
ncbi:transcription factor IIIB 50 kDa subunit-like [Anneissia japonica]|uniref:transcription factor IIIB 50 kDa subunit-like n=1 Tax=Anneissia japonica TaxID=1529436 RepID=UPI001425B749|nr:transcription factor IIIB 50 kDa subunit-like [Anneissia japonica]XP_033102797.1 transcription factor IIIB 50 kDa subunit-like [Anneissia japonica]